MKQSGALQNQKKRQGKRMNEENITNGPDPKHYVKWCSRERTNGETLMTETKIFKNINGDSNNGRDPEKTIHFKSSLKPSSNPAIYHGFVPNYDKTKLYKLHCIKATAAPE